jgi:sugar/nucleoside kinase (ribokinase family)
MSKIIVIGSVNHDRVWTLNGPLRSGSRLSFARRTVMIGGGGFYTASQLLRLGEEVVIVTRLMDDELGHAALKELETMGFDVSFVTMHSGETALAEILLEPSGERTIIADAGRPGIALSARERVAGDAAYINALLLDETLLSSLDHIPLVISQFPLRPAVPRPADIVITSRTDVAGKEMDAVWEQAREIAGTRLRTLVLTDGPGPISLYDGQSLTHVEPPTKIDVVNTLGAGDSFAGCFVSELLRGKDLPAAAAGASRLTAGWLSQRDASA